MHLIVFHVSFILIYITQIFLYSIVFQLYEEVSLAYYDHLYFNLLHSHGSFTKRLYKRSFSRHDFISPEVIHGFRGTFFLLIQILFTGKNVSKILVNLAAKAEYSELAPSLMKPAPSSQSVLPNS